MIDYMKNMLIGLFVVVACALVVGIILFLEPSVGDGKETLVARFSNVNGLSLGTRVMFAGKPVGEVVAIQQIPHAREQPTDELGQVYFYQLILHLDSSVHVYNTDEITVQTSGLLGEKSIAIIPRTPPKGVKPTLMTSKTPIYAESVDPLESAFNELAQLSDKVEETLDKVIAWIDQNGHELGGAIRAFDDAMTEATITLTRINQTHLIDEVKLGVQNFAVAMRDIHSAMDDLNSEDAFRNLAVTLRNTKKASYSFDHVMNSIASGKGTLGKLFMDEDTYLRVTAILSKLDTTMNDVNHYGFLFNLNKEWQRTRLKQATILNALNTPQSFRNYFNKEVDLINTSMSRLSMLVERAENSPDSQQIFDTKAFQRDFAELMRQSQALYDNLRLYNEQLQSAEELVQ
ncbi:MlaD family protein [Candidatus Neptunichlamydia sp. REUL1]|uniref:MlaD family protein n=1 Tax=Candidatus Neptunichlamydia sp. REUL1 TaxID=3064277 RepID=UPI00292D6E28|nr:MlaD family protein [Candidatus Neptunochlamydia sp. REUL1]